MKRSTLLFGMLICAGLITVALLAGAEGVPAGSDPETDVDAQITALLEMPAAERRAYLKALDPAERSGLWFRVRKALAAQHGLQPQDYSDLEPFPVELPNKSKAMRPKAVGTIAYDSGFPTIGFGGGAIVGNRFNTHTGIPVLNPGTVSTIQALVVPGPANDSSDVGFVLLGPQTGGGGAQALFSSFTNATGVIDSVTFAGLGVTYTGSSFFVLFGDFASVYIPVFGTGTTLGQGHHGVVGYTGGMGPNITGTFDFGGALNSYIRATGNIVPVELMSFDAE